MKIEKNEIRKRYVCVFRSIARVSIPFEEPPLTVRFVASPGFPEVLVARSLEHKTETGRAVPLGVRFETVCPAADINEAYGNGNQTASMVGMLLAFTTNAHVASPDPEYVFDASPLLIEREYTAFCPGARDVLPLPTRRVDLQAVIALFQALHDKNAPRLIRALAQYNLALGAWRPGYEILALNNLYVAVEILTDLALERARKEHGSDDALIALWKVPDAEEGNPKRMSSLKVAVRRHVIFQGDQECYQKARIARNGLVHGFASYFNLMEDARAVRDPLAAHIRRAVLDELDLDVGVRDTLLSPPYDKPFDALSYVKVDGVVTGSVLRLTSADAMEAALHVDTHVSDKPAEEPGVKYLYDVAPRLIGSVDGVPFIQFDPRWVRPIP